MGSGTFELGSMAFPGKRILIVEDDDINLMIAQHVLKKTGYVIETADNGETAVEIVKDRPFDLILMDIEMPIMGGLEATPLIRELEYGRAVPIIALTAHSLPEKLEQFKAAGITDYLTKPIDKEKFASIADRFLSV
ncbi:response regulator [Pontibacter sp. G13]|uniref:response regulator n=1 Tax=Pontibacter sp. G13 TaxID=3074898 RepID=UPI00288A7B0B|nr:response regulator [Pontibacter sp. G13]WNJ21022.1 response regulator [Pontibacter sp. G13]